MSNKTKLAVIGTGYWGKNLLRNFNQLGALAAYCDGDEAMRAPFATLYPDSAPYADAKLIFENTGIDAVAIATPAATHGALTRMALEAGKHVFVEKPLCLDVAEAEELRDLAVKLDRTLMVGHLLLYHPAFRAVQDLVNSDRLGNLRYIYSNRLSLGKIRKEENALWSFAPHDISMILALVGQMPETVVASGGDFLHDGVADTTLSHFTFANNIRAHVFVSWLHPYKDHRMVVVGDAAMVAFNDAQPGEGKVQLYAHSLGWDGDIPFVTRAEAQPVPYGADEPLAVECQAFLNAINLGTAVPSNADEGVRVLKVLQACQSSISTGNPVGP